MPWLFMAWQVVVAPTAGSCAWLEKPYTADTPPLMPVQIACAATMLAFIRFNVALHASRPYDRHH